MTRLRRHAWLRSAAPSLMLSVQSGPCSIVHDPSSTYYQCAQSPNYPHNYANCALRTGGLVTQDLPEWPGARRRPARRDARRLCGAPRREDGEAVGGARGGAHPTAAYKVLNEPLRDLARTDPPLPRDHCVLARGIARGRRAGRHDRRGRGVHNEKGRGSICGAGFADTEVTEAFSQNGGTNRAHVDDEPRSRRAVRGGAQSSLIFKLRTDSFMQRGARSGSSRPSPRRKRSYPPPTYLKPTGKTRTVVGKGRFFTGRRGGPAVWWVSL